MTSTPTKITAYWEIDAEKEPEIQVFEFEGQHLLFGAIASKFVRLNKLPESQELHFYLKGATDEKWSEPYQMYCSNLRHSACRLKSSSYTVCVRSEGMPSPDMIPPGELKAQAASRGLILSSADFINAFGRNYTDPNNLVQHFRRYLRLCMDKFYSARQRYMAPYVVLVQSSGYGKSRLMLQLAKTDYLVYVSFQRLTGCPRKTEPLASALIASIRGMNIDSAEHMWKCFLVSVVHEIVVEKSGWPFHSMDGVVLPSFSVEELNKMLERIQGEMQTFREQHAGKAIIFAMDEARTLLNMKSVGNLDAFRCALRAVAVVLGSSVFAILTDTSSTVTNFSPVTELDASSRSMGVNLFSPYFRLTTANVIGFQGAPSKSSRMNLYELVLARNVDRNARVEVLCKGRPLWATYGNELYGNVTQNIERVIIGLALNKLLLPPTPLVLPLPDKLPVNLGQNQLLAILACRLGLGLNSRSGESAALVGSHMATLVHVSEDRYVHGAVYAPEAALSVAASIILQRPEELKESVRALCQFCQLNIIEGGARGEIIMRLLLMLAWDAAVMNRSAEEGSAVTSSPLSSSPSSALPSYTVQALTVSRFLEVFLGRQLLEDMQLPQELADGLVSFSQFSPLFYTPRQSTLRAAIRHATVLIGKQNAPGLDLLMPVVLPSGKPSFIAIQVKNRGNKTSGYLEGAREGLSPKSMFEGTDLQDHAEPYVGLYMNLRMERPSTEIPPTWKTKTDNDVRGAIFGLDPSVYPFLTKDMAGQLRSLLDARSINKSIIFHENLKQITFFVTGTESPSDMTEDEEEEEFKEREAQEEAASAKRPRKQAPSTTLARRGQSARKRRRA